MDGRFIEQTRLVAYSLLYFACALLALVVSGAEDNVAAIWPASGIFVAGLLRVRQDHHGVLIMGVAVASFAANLIGGVGVVTSFLYTIANILEGLFVWLLMGSRRRASFIDPKTLARFVLSIAVGSLASAIMAGVLAGTFTLSFLSSWSSTVFLGMATVTPTIMFMMHDKASRRALVSLRGFLVIGFVAALTAAAFAQSQYPVLFLPMAGIAAATYMVGLSGASMALVLVTAIGSYYTANETGPVSTAFETLDAQVIYFQAYLLCLIASIIPLAFMLSRHQGEAERNRVLAETDELTNLATRRKILARLEDAMEHARASKKPLAIAMIDIDHFKSINDEFGHIHGDRILAALSDMMRAELAATGELGRLGGEEFIAIFSDETARDIFDRCDALRERAATTKWPVDGPDKVTLSIGIAQFRPSHEIAGQMLRDADVALYRAKDEGRNLVLVYEQTEMERLAAS
ncbi:GGDEF domain-containing protein [Sphingomicrobium clamense]|uniref:diguanylate cyclase n=1 Tax=Sphingomicrobium clamense TaxID=2851013 RepID=A0ABS6V6E7_9SPHN|nr:diguanylate cyclase [Sphingomicrobium sp. B8]MBW0145135.1 diguanylate cyclase [Sphingomicrobium sp. B8]